MTKTNLLLEAINKSGLKREWIAQQMGITRASLFSKVNNETEFKASEVIKLTNILSLSDEKRDIIFLSSE